MYSHRQIEAVLQAGLSFSALLMTLFLPIKSYSEQRTPLTFIGAVPLPQVKGGFDLMAADINGQRLFLAAQDNNTLEVIDLANKKLLRSVPGFNEPKWVVYRPESNRLYISNGGDGSVRVLDAQTFVQSKQYSFREKANNLRYDVSDSLLFVGVGKTFGEIAIIDAAKDTSVGTITLSAFPKQFEVVADRIYVNVPKANHVAVIDRKAMKQIAAWPVAAAHENVPMGIDQAQQRLFIGCEPGKLAILDMTNGTSVASLDISAEPDSIYYDKTRRLIYISCGAGFIDVIRQLDADHYEVVSKIPTAPGAATALFIPGLNRYCLAVPQTDKQTAELRLFSTTDK